MVVEKIMKWLSDNRLSMVLLVGCIFMVQPTMAMSLAKSDIGIRADVNVGPGKPVNDMLGASMIGHIPFNELWLLGLALSVADFDVERPNSELGLMTQDKLDAEASSVMLSSWIERRINEQDSGSYWFWTAGMGLNSVDVNNLKGTTISGEDFELKFDIDIEVEMALTAGRRDHINKNWVLGYGLKAAYRFGDWHAKNLLGTEKKTIHNSYDVSGVFVETSYQF